MSDQGGLVLRLAQATLLQCSSRTRVLYVSTVGPLCSHLLVNLTDDRTKDVQSRIWKTDLGRVLPPHPGTPTEEMVECRSQVLHLLLSSRRHAAPNTPAFCIICAIIWRSNVVVDRDQVFAAAFPNTLSFFIIQIADRLPWPFTFFFFSGQI